MEEPKKGQEGEWLEGAGTEWEGAQPSSVTM